MRGFEAGKRHVEKWKSMVDKSFSRDVKIFMIAWMHIVDVTLDSRRVSA